MLQLNSGVLLLGHQCIDLWPWTVTSQLGDKPTGRQSTGRQTNRGTTNWATTFGQLSDKLLNYFFASK